MRATLIHNPTAGSEQPSTERLVGWLRDTGYAVRYASSKRRAYVQALEDPGDLVVVAGGDGTVTKIAKRIAGRDVPLAILPLGTSNNIANTLGVEGSAEEIIRELPAARHRWLDVGVARAPWGTMQFLESSGLGLFAAILDHAERTEPRDTGESTKEKIALGAQGTLRVLAEHAARHYYVEVDGADLSGDYVLAVAMNIKRIGSALELAPDADPADGKLDLVLLREEDRETLGTHLVRLAQHPTERFPLTPLRATAVRIGWDSAFGHLDDERWPDASAAIDQPHGSPIVELTIDQPRVPVLVGTAAATHHDSGH